MGLKAHYTYLSEIIFMENINYTMNSLEEGRWGRVIRLDTKGDMRRRLQDIGLVEGTMVKCLRKSPSGDPVAYLIRGAVIALRSADSSEIYLA
jgi:ferrous iron transport protein A